MFALFVKNVRAFYRCQMDEAAHYMESRSQDPISFPFLLVPSQILSKHDCAHSNEALLKGSQEILRELNY